MSRKVLLLGLVLGVVILYQINLGRVTFDDAINMVGEEGGGDNLAEIMKNGVGETVTDLIDAGTGGDEDNEIYNDLTILAFGDMMLGRNVRTLMDKNGMHYVFDHFKKEGESFFEGMDLEETDVVFGNLEGPIKGKGRSGGTSMVFGFNEDVAAFLERNSFKLLSIANNHALDQGWDGRATTMKALKEANLGFCGHPSEADPESVYYGKDGERTFAFICFQDVTFKLNDEDAIRLIESVGQNVDYLIVSIHWGNEYQHKPDIEKQIKRARTFVDAGADFIIGHHPHVVQTFEVYKDRLIFYSLGNFVFDQYWSNDTQEGLGLRISLNASKDGFRTKVQLLPMKSEKSQSRLMKDDEKAKWLEKFIGYGEYNEGIKAMIKDALIEVLSKE